MSEITIFIPTPLTDALEDSISSGTFIDTKFWAFSRKNRQTGRLEHPRAVFTNSALVRRIPYLCALLDGVPEGPLGDPFPQDVDGPLIRDYEYESDTDLNDGTPRMRHRPPRWRPAAARFPRVASYREPMFFLLAPILLTNVPHVSGLKPGRTIIIMDAALVTLHAVFVYLYTGEIGFNTPEKIGSRFGVSSDIPLPSAKSVYRLADKYGIPDLKESAFLEIKSEVKTCNIVEDSFGKFSSWYPEIQELYMYRLAQAVRSSEPPGIATAFETKIQEYLAGELPHAEDLLLSLFDFLATNKMSPHPSPPRPSHPTIMSCSNVNKGSWMQVRNALIHSLGTGSFLDSASYVEDSMELRPLFFCSFVLPGSVEIADLAELILIRELRGDTEPATSVVGQDGIGEKVIKITSGDWNTWKSIFWYIYTGNILFAPIETDSSLLVAGSSSNPEAPHEGADMKVVYDLATKISLEPLRKLVGRNIESSMTHVNIVEELLSPFSAEHEAIREMQYRLLQQEFWTTDVQRGLRRWIEESDGQTTHFGSAMVAVFRGLTRTEAAEEPAETIRRSTSHIEPELPDSSITLAFQTIMTASAHRGAS